MPTEFVRVRDKDKTESSLPVRRAKQLADRGDVEILDKEAVNGFGEPLPPARHQDDTPAADDTAGPATDSTPAKRTAGTKSKEQDR